MLPDLTTIFLVVLSGLTTGTVLGLTGGGGSVLAVPLLIYVAGLRDPHIAIGTSALAVGATAITSMASHWKRGNVRLKEGLIFGVPGVAGTVIGAQLGLLTPASSLILAFAGFMVIMGVRMFRKKQTGNHQNKDDGRIIVQKKKVTTYGFLVGMAAGYFGIGGGFLIVPVLMHAAGLNIIQAVGTSLLSVSMFGLSTAGRYFASGNVDLFIALLFIAGGIPGSVIGARLAIRIPKENLAKAFGLLIIAVAAYIIARSVFQ
ncbi:MAG: hypothetical protein DA330_01215 [Nitrososphaera sp.]|nr:hypothetical protein [Nitrososphaera sp.]